MKRIYQAPTEEADLLELDLFEEKWGKKYPSALKSWRNNWCQLSTFYKYPPAIRNTITGWHEMFGQLMILFGDRIQPGDYT